MTLAEGRDACLAPVLSFEETHGHACHVARADCATLVGIVQPASARGFGARPAGVPLPARRAGEGGAEALEERGVAPERVDEATRSEVMFPS